MKPKIVLPPQLEGSPSRPFTANIRQSFNWKQVFAALRYRIAGDRGLLVEFGEGIDREVNRKVRAMALLLEQHALGGIVEVIPTYRSLLLIYDPLKTDPDPIRKHIEGLEARLETIAMPVPITVEIPVRYGGELGPDLDFVAQAHSITPREVVQIHTARPYPIYMIGFTPGYAYLGELPGGLVTPRRETPRTHVPKGSVGIAKNQTGVYPVDSPGGWQIIGRTPLELFNPNKWPPALLNMGDLVTFYAIDKKEMIHWQR